MYKKASSGLIAITTTLVLGLSSATQAEELAVPVMDQADRTAAQELPKNGQTQQTVRTRLGNPNSMNGPVGQPPITTWDYSRFTVYFEGDKVIHTVMKPNR